MKLIFLLLTLIFCFSFVRSKDQVSFKHFKADTGEYWDVDRSETDSKEKLQLHLIPLVHNFISVPEPVLVFVYSTHTFTFSFHPIVTSAICSQGPPHV